MNQPLRIAVIGVGPRGLSALERVISHARADVTGPPVELLLIEPGELGNGMHQLKQPDYLLLNTIASQLTIFSDERMTPGAPVTTGPGFFEWCGTTQGPVRFDEFLPRRLLGEYLQWAAGELQARAPQRLTVRHLRVPAESVVPGPGDDRTGAVVTLADGERHRVDLAIVTTGHGLPQPSRAAEDGVIDLPYPLPEQVDAIPGGATVALLGTGLTAMDVIASLTVGRGGEFGPDGYRPSGREPRIVLANRNGWLPCARPATTRERRAAPAAHLTADAVAALRTGTADGRLDFARDIEPLVLREALGRMASATPAETDTVQRILQPSAERFEDYRRYTGLLVERAEADLREAVAGLGASAVKEGLEVLRDHRDGLRAAVDPPGLTEESHGYFMKQYSALVNRSVIGPQKERIQELLQLIEAGVVLPGPGPRPLLERDSVGWSLSSTALTQPHRIYADLVVRANLEWPSADSDTDPVGRSLRGWAASGPGGGPALDRDGFVVPRGPVTDPGATADPGTAAGRRSVAVFGPPAEGASYYNHYVPSPGVWSRALTDLDRAIVPVLGPGTAERPTGHSPDRDHESQQPSATLTTTEGQ